jgi:ubiquitin-conjugating enzyme E2 O
VTSSRILFSGLILVSEPYFNEAGYERQKGTQQGIENSRMYNEMALLKLVQVNIVILFLIETITPFN